MAFIPTSIDRFFGVSELCRDLSGIQNNMRANVQIIQASAETSSMPLYHDWPNVQQAVRDLGLAFNQRLDRDATIVNNFTTYVQDGTAAIGVSFSDMTSVYNLLSSWATKMQTATITNQTQLDNSVTALLAAVPPAILPFGSTF